jgi:hypothetical protein
VSLETVSEDQIAGRLSECEALSYVWGIPTVGPLNMCNGAWLRITPNLGDALEALRHPTERKLLWADAICINQRDPNERNHQIKLMAQIYSTAKRVLVWLGRIPLGWELRQAELLVKDTKYFEGVLDGAVEIPAFTISTLQKIASSPWFSRMRT